MVIFVRSQRTNVRCRTYVLKLSQHIGIIRRQSRDQVGQPIQSLGLHKVIDQLAILGLGLLDSRVIVEDLAGKTYGCVQVRCVVWSKAGANLCQLPRNKNQWLGGRWKLSADDDYTVNLHIVQ